MSSEIIYYAPEDEMSDDNERHGLIVYELDKGKVYNQLQPTTSRTSTIRSQPTRISNSKKVRLLVTLCILLTEMGERLTYYSLVANIILYAKSELGYDEVDAATLNQVFAGLVFLIPIGGGFIADSYTGRFKTIVASALVYIVGIAFILASAVGFESLGSENLTERGRRGFFLSGLTLIALGTGGIKANVGPFGAEQLEELGKDAVQSFFNWFYWVVNVGAFIAYVGVSYIQQEISFAWGYLIPFISMILSLIIFISVKHKYLQTKPKGSVLTTAFSICIQGCCKKTPPENPKLPAGTEKKILARAKVSFGGDHYDHLVDGVTSVMKVIPFCILLIIYWVVYAQMTNTFYVQGIRMDIRLGDGINVPVAALNIFNTLTIIVLIPLVDKCLYPFFEKIGRPLTYLKRIGIGMVLAALSVFVAGIVEIERKELMKDTANIHEQIVAGESYNASSLSIFLQIPQFALIGASEIFSSITALEFAYNQAPVAMQGLLTGLILAANGFGNLLSSALLKIVQDATRSDPWWGNDINEVKMENLMFLIGGLMLANLLVFVIISHFYSYQDPSAFEIANEEEKEETKFDGDPAGEETRINQNNSSKSYMDNKGYSPGP